jgi:penicillin-binding protein 1A
MMRQVLISGSGAGARIGGYDLAGKTGTTSDYRDAWFVGYTGGFVASVWVGKDNNTPMKAVTGGAFPARIWKSFMLGALPKLKITAIPGVDPPPNAAPAPARDAAGDLLEQPPSSAPPGANTGKTPEFF